jgi:hypothetical protein
MPPRHERRFPGSERAPLVRHAETAHGVQWSYVAAAMAITAVIGAIFLYAMI